MDTTTIPSAPVEATEPLSALLDRELRYDPRAAHGGFISHTAMAMIAAWRLGAGAAELQRWLDDDAASDFLRPRTIPSAVADQRLDLLAGRDGTGDPAATRRALTAAVRSAGPTIARSPLSQFFHGAIRLEYALDATHAGQVANALHNWQEHPSEFPDPTPRAAGEPRRRLLEVATELVTTAPSSSTDRGPIRQIAETEWFRDAMGQVHLTSSGLHDEVADVALRAHVAGDNFTTLHQVTGMRAVRVVGAWLAPADNDRLAAAAAQALLLTLVDLDGELPDDRHLDHLRREPTAAWADISEAARASGDHHVVKLAYTARREEEATGDPAYRWLAARQCGLT